MPSWLKTEIVKQMKWEEERVRWVGGSEWEVRVKKVEEFRGGEEWRKFGCYDLVETFVLKRMDGCLVIIYDFLDEKYAWSSLNYRSIDTDH